MKTRPRFLVPSTLLLLSSPGLAQDPRPASDPGSIHGDLSVTPDSPAPRSEDTLIPITFEGSVFEPDGTPAEGAVVVSSVGGKVVADWNGNYRLDTQVPVDAQSVRITAVGVGGGTRTASSSVLLPAASSVARVGPLWLARGAGCSPSWLPTFGGLPGVEGVVYALAAYDDGGGPALYVAGGFTVAGGVPVNYLAKWDGSGWGAVGNGPGLAAVALMVYDDGDGPALYAGGGSMGFGGIRKWDGSIWSIPGGAVVGDVVAMAVYDDGGGSALYAGGLFGLAGGVSANNVAKWDGSSWSALGAGTTDSVSVLTVYDDGGGPALFAGGSFTTAGGVSANRIAKWNGSSWSALGSGMGSASNTQVRSLAAYDDGSGSALYAGGFFTSAGGGPANSIAKWNGLSWSALGSGTNGVVNALAVFDDGGGPVLVVGGGFTSAGGVAANGIARWNGSNWAALGTGINACSALSAIHALAVCDIGSGPELYVGGGFGMINNVPANSIARTDGSTWAALGSGISATEQIEVCIIVDAPSIRALTVYDDGGGQALYAAGTFTVAEGLPMSRIAQWNGSGWVALGSGTNAPVNALVVYDDGGGPALYAGGSFTAAGGVSANRIAKWNGSSWAALGSGTNNIVHALAVYDDGGGPALYAAGRFTSAGGAPANHVAKWNGASWAALGSGTNFFGLEALTVYDDGGGPALYVGGIFSSAGGVPASNIAKWDGANWSALGGGTANGGVSSLAVYDDGSGSALYAGGAFLSADGFAVPANSIAKWNGSSWAALGSGMENSLGAPGVAALAVHDDGSGSALYAGGFFTSAGGVPANNIAKWDGSGWTALGSGMVHSVQALTVYDDSEGPALYAGGRFSSAPDSGDSYLAKWGGEPDTTPPSLSCPSSVFAIDGFNGPPGEVVIFSVTAADDCDPSPTVVCVPSSGSMFSVGTTLVTCTATDTAGNESTCQFPVIVRLKFLERSR